MDRTKLLHTAASSRPSGFFAKMIIAVVAVATLAFALANAAIAADLKVMKTGLGTGTITSTAPGIICGGTCDATFLATASVTLTATPAAGSVFIGWGGDCSGALTCSMAMGVNRSVRAEFALAAAIPTLNVSDMNPAGIQAYLTANPTVNTPARFVKALPVEFKRNWILMTRSESLQTGIAAMPRILMPSVDAQLVFTIGLSTHSSYPAAHPNAIEFMQWDPAEKNFRFHEIVLDAIPAIGSAPARTRGVSADDAKCSKCHSTRNVLNTSSFPGTTGVTPGTVKVKNKPNWDTYDSWAGMLPFNRDRIYKGSVEAAAFRKLFNLWTWRGNESVRSIIEQLELQPPGVPGSPGVPAIPGDHTITRINGGTYDGHIRFGFDTSMPTLIEPAPTGSGTINTAYEFNGAAGMGATSPVVQGGDFVTLHHSADPTFDEGRGVQLFDLLSGGDGVRPNQKRVADEIASHRFATGSVPIDVRPIALAITKSCLAINVAANTVTSAATTPPAPPYPALAVDLGFFTARSGLGINALVTDTRTRAQSLPRRKADLQKLNLVRDIDTYLAGTDPAEGVVTTYGAATSAGADTSLARLRQEIFRRPGGNDSTVMGGIYVDRENYSPYTEQIALFRYFLEPLGVSVDKWSPGVRGRSRTYTFADLFTTYTSIFQTELQSSLTSEPVAGLAAPFDCGPLISAVNATLSSLPPVNEVPKFTDVQRIFNKSCIECHGGLNYPPYSNYSVFPSAHVDFSEDEAPPPVPSVSPRLARSHAQALGLITASPATSYLYQRITATGEDCPFGLMPCGGPALSKTDIETIRRWIVGPPSAPFTVGDPHIRTVDGLNYDFQSAGEFTLLRNENLEIQTRQTAISTDSPLPPDGHSGLSSCPSLNTAVAVRIGPHRITYQPNIKGEPDPRGMELRIDGKLVVFAGNELILPAGGRIVRTSAPGGIQIEGLGGAVIVITPGWWDHYQVWYLNIDARNTRATEGIMGAVSRGGWLPALPDGSSLGPKPSNLHQRYLSLYGKFADAWRVNDKTTLFDYAPGMSTKEFTVATWPEESPKSCVAPKQPGGPIDRPPLKPLPLEYAQKVCAGIPAKDRRANCVQDVQVTGEVGFAKTYLAAEKIDLNKAPVAPTLIYPKENEVTGGDIVRFTWNRTKDPDGDFVAYRHCMWLAGETPTFNDCEVMKESSVSGETLSQAVGKLTSGKGYFWKVIAEDGNGGSTESETRRFTVK
jgi:Divergent InlB B-repeat domain